MIGSVQKTIKRERDLIVELSVQAFLTDEGYDPTLWSSSITSSNHEVFRRYTCCAMFIKTLYPNTKIHVRRKKVEGTLMTYTNELEVEVDFSDVDPSLLEESEDDTDSTVATLSTSMIVQINQTLKLFY
jgi:hypothetical protein